LRRERLPALTPMQHKDTVGAMTICQPNPCPCHPWSIRPGDQQPLLVDWAGWLASVPGYSLNSVVDAELLDLKVNPPAPADPDELALVSGLDVDPPSGNPGFTKIVGTATENLIRAGTDVPVGRAYRLNLAVAARDCMGRKIRTSDCIFITTSQV
jgi:hypothetical protein